MSNLRIYLGVALTSISTLSYEIALTRIFSIMLWYHFAFMIVSIAMLGLAASGTCLTLYPQLKDKERLFSYSFFLSITILLSYTGINQIPFDPVRMAWDKLQVFYISLYYITLSIPFFFAGLILATALSSLAERAGIVYFFDLLGASFGSLGVLFLLSLLTEGDTILVITLLPLIASLLFKKGWKWGFIPFTLMTLVVITTFFIPSLDLLNPRISPYKGLPHALKFPGAELLKTKRNAFSRIDIIKSPAVRFAPGLSLEFQEPLPPQLGLSIDGGELNAITEFKDDRDKIEFIDYLPSSLPYHLNKFKSHPDTGQKRVLILWPKGGLSILTALYYGVDRIDKVEGNPLIVATIKKDYRDFTGGIYDRGVEIGIGRGLKSKRGPYDLIDIPLTEAIPSAPLFGILEDYRFTEEAFRSYYKLLADGGYLSITRYLTPPPTIELRLTTTIISMLEGSGSTQPERQLIVIRSLGAITILIKKGVWNEEEIKLLKEFTSKRRFDIVYYPGVKREEVNIYNRFPQPIYFDAVVRLLDRTSRDSFIKDYLFDISPVRDDRPFFYHFLKLSKLKEVYEGVGRKGQFFLEGGYLLPFILLQASIIGFSFILAPLLLRNPLLRGQGWVFLYFSALGLGFMFLEVSLIERFILYLDYPVYAVATVLAALLLSSGIGSILSQRFLPHTQKAWNGVLIVLVLLIPLYAVLLPFLFEATSNLNLLPRELLSIILLFFIGLFLGMPFPLGIRRLKEKRPELIPWAWGVNGCLSVVSAVMVTMVAIYTGFTGVMYIACGAYLIALISSSRI